jgi:hypothetical protein
MMLGRVLMRRSLIAAAVGLVLTGGAAPAYADLTGFVGSALTPSNRTTVGGAFGINVIFIGVEFEYAGAVEDLSRGAPSLKTGSGNLMLQTPVAVFGLTPYFTVGGGVYHEALGDTHSETNLELNTGGGVKVALIGPVRARFDYRVLKLQGDAVRSVVHRLYAGLNLSF